MNAKIYFGKLGKPKGLKGELRLHLVNPDSDYCQPGNALYIEGMNDPLLIAECKPYQKCLLVTFEGFRDVDQASNLVGKKVFIHRDQLPASKDNEYYHVDLIGCQVWDQHQHLLGEVKEVLFTGANDVLSIKNQEGVETLVAFHKNYVLDVDLQNKTIKVFTPEVLS